MRERMLDGVKRMDGIEMNNIILPVLYSMNSKNQERILHEKTDPIQSGKESRACSCW
jgi:hypothetical protein